MSQGFLYPLDLSGYLQLIGGIMAGAIDMDGFAIQNLANPTNPNDALSLSYAQSLFFPLAGGALSGNIDFANAYTGINVIDPVNPQDIATKHYVDLLAGGFVVKPAVYCASIAPFNAVYNNGAAGVGATLTDNSGTFAPFTCDGATPALNDTILYKDATNPVQNGDYELTQNGDGISVPWVITRTTYYDQPSEINPGDFFLINNGSQAGQAWLQTADVTTIGTDPILFSLFGSGIYALKGANSDIFSLSGITGGISSPTFVQMANGGAIRTGQTDGNTALLQAYDVDGAAYFTFATLTAGNTPSLDFSALTTIGGNLIAIAGANDNITSMIGLTGYLQAPLGIKDTNGNILESFTANPNAVNYIDLTNGILSGTALTQNPYWTATGSSTNISSGFMPKGQGAWCIFGNLARAGTLQLFENSANGLNKFSLKAPESMAADLELVAPSTDGISGQGLVTDGFGNLSFGSPLNNCKNFIINGNMWLWQRHTSIANQSTVTNNRYYGADRWGGNRSGEAPGQTCSIYTLTPTDRFNAGAALGQYATKWQRVAGDTSTAQMFQWYSVETADSLPMAGQTVTFSVYMKTGANYSGGIVAIRIAYGTGVNQRLYAFTGLTYSTVLNASPTTSFQRFQLTMTIPVTATQVGIQMNWQPSGTAGADDSIYYTGAQLEIGNVATPLEVRPVAQEIMLCQRYYEKSYSAGYYAGATTAPGAISMGSGSVTGTFNQMSVRYNTQKIAATPVVLYGYSNGVAGNITQFDGTAIAGNTSNQGVNGFLVNWTNTAGKPGANFHFVTDVDL